MDKSVQSMTVRFTTFEKTNNFRTSDLSLQTLYVGISAAFSETNTAVIAIAIRDAVYLQDFSVKAS